MESDNYELLDCENMTDDELSESFVNGCICLLQDIYPDLDLNTISPDSISIGNIYRNKYHISCQIKFTENDFIFQCTYYKKDKLFQYKCYALIGTKKYGIVNTTDSIKE